MDQLKSRLADRDTAHQQELQALQQQQEAHLQESREQTADAAKLMQELQALQDQVTMTLVGGRLW